MGDRELLLFFMSSYKLFDLLLCAFITLIKIILKFDKYSVGEATRQQALSYVGMWVGRNSMEGNLILLSKITYKFTLWLSNPTSKNLSQWFDGKNPERHIHNTIHYSTICKNNTGSNLNDQRSWITHGPPIQWSTTLSLQKNEEDPYVLLEVISLQAVKRGKERKVHIECCHLSEGLVRGSMNIHMYLPFLKNDKWKFFWKVAIYGRGKEQGGGGGTEVRIFWIYLFWDLALKPYKYFM